MTAPRSRFPIRLLHRCKTGPFFGLEIGPLVAFSLSGGGRSRELVERRVLAGERQSKVYRESSESRFGVSDLRAMGLQGCRHVVAAYSPQVIGTLHHSVAGRRLPNARWKLEPEYFWQDWCPIEPCIAIGDSGCDGLSYGA